MTLSNTGMLPLSIAGIAIAGANPADFAQTNNCGASLAAGANCAIAVTFVPTATGIRSATLSVTDALGTRTIPLRGTGAVLSSILLPNAPRAFAAQKVGTVSAAQTVTLTNTGVLPLGITSIGLAGINANQFTRSFNCTKVLPAGGSCTISVAFKPTVAGAKSAMLTVVDDTGTRNIALSGTGQ